MKKSLLVLGALAILSVAFVGCKGNGDTTGDDTSNPSITTPSKVQFVYHYHLFLQILDSFVILLTTR